MAIDVVPLHDRVVVRPIEAHEPTRSGRLAKGERSELNCRPIRPSIKRTVTLCSLILLLVSALSARDIPLVAGTVDPSAQGKLSIKKQKDGTQDLKVEVQHLALPSALTPPKMGYVVWIQPPDRPPENHGALKLNHNMQGSFQTTTAYPRYQVFVTAEDNLQVTQPSGPEVLRASVAPE